MNKMELTKCDKGTKELKESIKGNKGQRYQTNDSPLNFNSHFPLEERQV